MKFCPAIKKALLTGRNYFFLFLIIFSSNNLTAQETNSRASGKVFADSNETVSGVTVTIIHEPTQNKYVDATRSDGYFNLFNLKPGGPYSIIFSSAGYESLKKTDLFIHLTGDHFFFGDVEMEREDGSHHEFDPPDHSRSVPRERIMDVDRQVNRLPTEFKVPLMMLAVDGLTIPEIAEILEIPQGTVKSRVFYARKRLKNALENRLERNRK